MDPDTSAPKKSKLPLIAAIYLVAMLCFVWGFAVARYQVFPWALVAGIDADISAFLAGDVDDDTTAFERLLNDSNLVPERQMRTFSPSEPGSFREVELAGKRSRREQPRVYLSPDAPASYRIIAGAFDFEDAFWGAVLLDPAGNVVHRWRMQGDPEARTGVPDVLLNLYGIGFFFDGSAAYSLQEWSGGLFKVDVCSRFQWILQGQFHHTAAPTEDASALWTFAGEQTDKHPVLLLIDRDNGRLLKQIDMAAVERANPDVLIFDLQRNRNTPDATHPNDIEPLPAALAGAFPEFSPGDLLLSYHTTNLVFVLDPETLEIKWWYVGSGDGQHDPDWQRDGTITVFNNNYRAEWRQAAQASTIVEIDPTNHAHRVIVDGNDYDFYSEINGHHLVTADDTVLITSSTQGRVFEVDLETGDTVFEFVNAYEWGQGRTLHLSEAFVVDAEMAEQWSKQGCPN